MLLVACPLLLSLSAFVMVVEQSNWINLYPDSEAHQNGSLHRSLFNVLYSVPLIVLLLIGIIAGQKYTINLKIQYSSLSSNQNDDCCWRVAKFIVIVLFLLQTVLSSAVLLFGSYLLLLVNTLYWLFTVVIVWVCAIGLWLALEKSIHVRYCFEGNSAMHYEWAKWYSQQRKQPQQSMPQTQTKQYDGTSTKIRQT